MPRIVPNRLFIMYPSVLLRILHMLMSNPHAQNVILLLQLLNPSSVHLLRFHIYPRPTCLKLVAISVVISYKLVDCAFSRQIWALILQCLSLLNLAPGLSDSCFIGSWRKAIAAVTKDSHKGLNSLIILVPWEVWTLETP